MSQKFLSKAYEKQFSEIFPFGYTINTNKKDIIGDTVYSVAIRGFIEKEVFVYDYCSFAFSYEEAFKKLFDSLDIVVAQYEEVVIDNDDEYIEFFDCQIAYKSFYETGEDYFIDEFSDDIAPMVEHYLKTFDNDRKETLKHILNNDIEYLVVLR